MALIAGLFLLSGVLRVLCYHRDLCDGFSSLFCAVMLLSWSVRIRNLVADRRLRQLILSTAASLLLFLTIQMFRGNLTFGSPVVARYSWYGYYVPYIGTPTTLFLCALAVYRPRTQPLPRLAWVVAAASALLALSALTNDLHQLCFRFPGGVFRDTELYTPGPLFWLYFFCYGALLLSSFVVSVVKAWQIRRGLSFLLPTIPPLLLGVWMIQNLLHAVPSVGGVKLWIESECFTFAIVAYLECCIQIGLIPANTSCGPLFSRLELSAVILDRAEQPVYRSGGLAWPFPRREDLQVRSQPISGGCVVWAVDLSPVWKLNRQLEEGNRLLDQRNAYLRAEAQMSKELVELETRNRLYDQVSEAVHAQLEELEALSLEDGSAFHAKLPRICLLTAFVKRRCNMELLSAGGSLSLEELQAALTESMEYLQLSGVETALTVTGGGELPAGLVISAYELLHAVVMEGLETMRFALLRVSGACGEDEKPPWLEARLLLRTDKLRWDFNRPMPGKGLRPAIRVSIEDGDLNLVLRFTEGGGEA